MTALPQSFAMSQAPMRTAPADREDGRISRDTDRDITAQSFEEAVQEQSGTADEESRVAENSSPESLTAEESTVAPTQAHAETQPHDRRVLPDATPIDAKADIIPIADPNGRETVAADTGATSREIDPSVPLPTHSDGFGNEITLPTRVSNNIEGHASASQTGAENWIDAGDLRYVPNSPANTGSVPATTQPTVTAPALPTGQNISETGDADINAVISRGAETVIIPQEGVTSGQTQTQTQTQTQGHTDDILVPQGRASAVPSPQGQNSELTPVTVGTAPADGRQADQGEATLVKPDVTPIAEVDGDADLRPTSKTATTLTEPTKPAVEVLRASDLPSIQTLPTASSDTLAAPKTLPLTPQVPTLTPIGGFGERMVANYIQTMPNAGPVTLDKLPQTVVALVMNAQSATLQIDPPELGRIQLEYQFDTQGKTVVTLVPESDAARTALAERMTSISAALSQNTPGEVDVRLGDSQNFNFDQQPDANDHGDEASPSANSQTSETNGNMGTLRVTSNLSFSRAPSGTTERLHILV